jgi:hypothetical protein
MKNAGWYGLQLCKCVYGYYMKQAGEYNFHIARLVLRVIVVTNVTDNF